MSASRRALRRSEPYLPAEGGPGLREVLPGFAVLAAVVCVPLAGLGWLYRRFDVLGLVAGVVVLLVFAVLLTPGARAALRRRRGVYTAAEFALLDDHGLMVATERMLRRDGWGVLPMPRRGQPRLYARDARGRRLDVVLSLAGAEAAADTQSFSTRVAPAPRPLDGERVHLVVGKEGHSQDERWWAAREPGVRLLGGRRLRRWASGVPLDELGVLERPGT
ncbi:hypothetical protein [Streptomyces sp. NPDC060194]|uniref:hypothetical protein n=1 Tax=Streptomyces sp. NPDC060194 TaxID=3347069 RepID=UPI00365C3397